MSQAKQGDTVKVHYNGMLDDGTLFETSQTCGPLQFTIGKCEVLPGIEQAVIGMRPGESKTVRIPADKAYGPYLPEKVKTIPRYKFPEEMKPEIGVQYQMRQLDGETLVYVVTDVSESDVAMDSNHPLAGKDLTFEIRLLEIV